MRASPEYKDIMPIIDEPICLGLIKVISIFRKHHYEHDEKHLQEILKHPKGRGSDPDETSLSNETTVLLMSHIVRELSHIYREVKKKNPVVRQSTIANTNTNEIVKSIESSDSFLENMTGSDGFDQMK